MSKRATNTSPSPSFFRRLGMPQLPPPWGMVDVVTMLVALGLTMLIIAGGVAVATSTTPELISPVSLAAGWGIGGLMVIGYVWLTRRRTAEDWEALRITPGLMALPLVLLLGVAIGAMVDTLAGLANGRFGPVAELRGLRFDDAGQLLLGIVLVCGVLPIAHGLAFTGVILPALRVKLGPWPGLLATAGVFTVYHFMAFGSTLTNSDRLWYGLFVPFMTMLLLAMLRVRTASTLASIVAGVGVGIIAITLAFIVR